MYKNIGNFFIQDGEEISQDLFELALPCDDTVYEVVRVLHNNVLFLEDHMDRLRNSLESVNDGSNMITEIKNSILTLVKGHNNWNKNIKIDVYNNQYRCYFMESYYPNEELYNMGVLTTTMAHDRIHPEIKKLNMAYKAAIEKIKNKKYFEVLLINETGYVYEGSRSNLLFVKENKLYSAPLKTILNGITFKNVIKMAQQLDVDILYENVHLDTLKEMDACFLTGTSLGVLPIQKIDDLRFDSANNPIVKALIKAYNGKVL